MNADTVEIPFPWFAPSVPTRYERPARLRRTARRLLNSPAASHVRASARSAFWPLAIGSGVVLAFVVLATLQGLAPSVVIR